MGIKSYENGKSLEQKVMSMYRNKGYFTYKIPTMIEGTVFDILAIKNNGVICIECKHINGNVLSFHKSGLYKKKDELNHFVDTTNTSVYIFIECECDGEDDIYLISWKYLYKCFEKADTIYVKRVAAKIDKVCYDEID